MLSAGRLRHRIIIQNPVFTQDQDTGDVVPSWEDLKEISAEVKPLSVKEFIAAQKENSKVTARITVRRTENIDATMRIVFRGQIYNIEGILPDPVSGLEYFTIPVSEGVRYQDDTP